MLPFDPLLEVDIGFVTDCSFIEFPPKVCSFAFEEERIGTIGPTVSSATFPCGAINASACGFNASAPVADESGLDEFDVADKVVEL